MSDMVEQLRKGIDGLELCIKELATEIEQLRAERDAYKGTLRYLAGEGVTAARRALEGK